MTDGLIELEDKIYWALTHGIIMGTGQYMNDKNDSTLIPIHQIRHAPFALKPFHLSLKAFNKAKDLTLIFNELIDNISRDVDWLIESLKVTALSDDFTNKILDIQIKIREELVNSSAIPKWYQSYSLGILRSDYMEHSLENDSRDLLQVEINTIASSFGALSNQITLMQQAFNNNNYNIPDNITIESISNGLATAHKTFITESVKSNDININDIVTLLVVQENEKNFSDQRLIQYHLLNKHNITCLRVSLNDIYTHSIVNEDTGHLLYKDKVISVVYYRSGYSPDDYVHESDWLARYRVERSLAIKCPNISYHLVGCKKIQQILAKPGILERFLGVNNPNILLLRSVFAGLYDLDPITDSSDESNQLNIRIRKDAIDNSSNYVIKPQREGGGNNYYNENVRKVLETFLPSELSAYILMERIFPPSQEIDLIRDGHITKTMSICELGIYGIILSNGGSNKLLNGYGGYLLRVKPISSDEGGVAAGYAVLGSPDLI